MLRLDEEEGIALEGGVCLLPHGATFKEVDAGCEQDTNFEAVLFEQGADPIIALCIPGKVVSPTAYLDFGSIGKKDLI